MSARGAEGFAEPTSVACAGAPRDLGFDQGRAARAAVRAAVAALGRTRRLRLALGADRAASRCARDALRHYPHASERLAGLARAAGVGRAALAGLLARELAAGPEPFAGGGEALAAADAAGGPRLARSLAAPSALFGAAPVWLVRHSAPEHDWRSVEVALPWLVPALAGVNERGLAVVGVVRPAGPDALAACAAPALLLVQECLQRCDGVAKALDWCERRPSGGAAGLLLADASGDAALVALDGERRRIERPRDGLLACAEAPRAAELAKRCAAHPTLDADALADVLSAPARAGEGARAAVVLEPAARALALRLPGGRRVRAHAAP